MVTDRLPLWWLLVQWFFFDIMSYMGTQSLPVGDRAVIFIFIMEAKLVCAITLHILVFLLMINKFVFVYLS